MERSSSGAVVLGAAASRRHSTEEISEATFGSPGGEGWGALMIPQFIEFDKIPRLKRGCCITEKIDGTNASILIPDDGETFEVETLGTIVTLPFLCGSRTRWIYPQDDNYGFAKWAYDHAAELLALGPGHHFGEWWGAGIQRRYGLTEKRFSLFNSGRWIESEEQRTSASQIITPSCCHVVPVLATGVFSSDLVDASLELLHREGSKAAPGFMKPEGVVVYLSAARALFKVTIEKDEEPKSKSN